MKRKNIKIRVTCSRDDGEAIAKTIQRALERSGFQALENPSFSASRKSAEDVLIYQDFINSYTEVKE